MIRLPGRLLLGIHSGASDGHAFRSARLQLTAWFVLTIAVLSILFSVALYAALASQLSEHRPEGPEFVPDRQVEREVSDFALSRLRVLLIGGNLVLLAGAACGGYFLAGRTLTPIARALERQRRFTADASHELRTPLTVMRGMLDVALQRQRTPEVYREALGDLGQEVDEMTALVERLLRLARGHPRGANAATQAVVQAVLEDVVRSTAALASDRGDTVQLAPAPPTAAAANASELRQVFVNLVTNALQHTAAGTQVSLAAEHRDGLLEVTVRDNGSGIPEEQREMVFEPFHRLESTGADGAGLGLALCRELVEANGGSIALQETPGGGTTVRVWLPLAD